MTSRLRFTLPKAIAVQYGIRPGDEVTFVAEGDAILVLPTSRGRRPKREPAKRARSFKKAMERRRRAEAARPEAAAEAATGRGWMREDLGGRGRAR